MPLGVASASGGGGGESSDATLWTLLKVPSRGLLFARSYGSQRYVAVDVGRAVRAAGSGSYALQRSFEAEDVTDVVR
jgi:hypothetical protein